MARDCSVTEPKATAVNLTILVSDQNDNSPKFSAAEYTVHIPDGTKPGKLFLFNNYIFSKLVTLKCGLSLKRNLS